MIDDALLTTDRPTILTITAILKRALQDMPGREPNGLSLSMDLAVCHNRGHIDLERLLGANRMDFVHDAFHWCIGR
jgi:hypothetical protein